MAILALALVLALGAMGVGYAHWSQTLYIEGTVETGVLCWGIEDHSFFDLDGYGQGQVPPYDSTSGVGMTNPRPTSPKKNVGSVSVTYEDLKGCEHLETPLYATLVVTLDNVYPCFYDEMSIRIANGGTIPVDIVSIKLDGVEVNDNDLHWNDYMEFRLLEPPLADLPYQLDPCVTYEFSFELHILEEGDQPGGTGTEPVAGAEEGETYEFDLVLEGVQWNLQ